MVTTLQFKMAIMMALPIRLKMQKRIGKQTPILLITTEQEWEVLYLPIQSKSGETIISTCLHFMLFNNFFASSSVRYNLLSRTRVPEVPQITI